MHPVPVFISAVFKNMLDYWKRNAYLLWQHSLLCFIAALLQIDQRRINSKYFMFHLLLNYVLLNSGSLFLWIYSKSLFFCMFLLLLFWCFQRLQYKCGREHLWHLSRRLLWACTVVNNATRLWNISLFKTVSQNWKSEHVAQSQHAVCAHSIISLYFWVNISPLQPFKHELINIYTCW